LLLIALVVEVFPILEQKPASSFEHLSTEKIGCIPVDVSSELGQLLVEQLDDVEMIKHLTGLGRCSLTACI
jgi:hypothetical protein